AREALHGVNDAEVVLVVENALVGRVFAEDLLPELHVGGETAWGREMAVIGRQVGLEHGELGRLAVIRRLVVAVVAVLRAVLVGVVTGGVDGVLRLVGRALTSLRGLALVELHV